MTNSRSRLLVPLAALALLAGCSQPASSENGPEVATVASAGPTVAASPSAAERPLVRSDMSADEKQRLFDVWQRCLVDNSGADLDTQKRLSDGGAGLPPEQKERYDKAVALCASKEPEQVWQRAKRLDPQYGDKLRDWVTCIRAFGIDAWEDNGYLAFNSLPDEKGQKHVDECESKAFGTA
jgi:hypothetical protein